MGKQTEEGKSGVVNLGFYVAGYSDITEQEKHLTVGIRAQTHVLISISFLHFLLIVHSLIPGHHSEHKVSKFS